MNLPQAKIIARYPGAFSSESVLDALLVLRGPEVNKAKQLRVRGDPDAPPSETPLSVLVFDLEQVLLIRHRASMRKGTAL